ncbi:MAG: adenylate/guanylate cyclase domain-containing protein [Bacteroidota bacterium]
MKYSKLIKRLYFPYVIGWTLSFFLFTIFRGVGTIPTGTLKIDLYEGMLLSLIVGPLCGFLSAVNQQYFERLVNKRLGPLYQLVSFKLLNTLFLLLFISIISYSVLSAIKKEMIDIRSFAFQPESFVAYLYILITDTFLSLFRKISILLGEVKIWRLLNGTYYVPRQEEKIFLFIDLRSSTSIAETLGHLQYSRLLQDIFNDISIIEKYDGEVYQYIGDEIVFTWDSVNSTAVNKAICSFLDFQNLLKDRSEKYIQKYGIVPTLKAGMHAGIVTAVEVGKNKKEIAYHGDTINTASRIQDTCNTFGENFMVSQSIADAVNSNLQFSLQKITDMKLQGKSVETTLYAVHNANDVLTQKTEMKLVSIL